MAHKEEMVYPLGRKEPSDVDRHEKEQRGQTVRTMRRVSTHPHLIAEREREDTRKHLEM